MVSRKRLAVVLAIGLLALLPIAGSRAFSSFMSASDSFTIGADMTVNNVGVGVDIPSASLTTSGEPWASCTQTTARSSAWSCTPSTTTLYAGSTVTWAFCASSTSVVAPVASVGGGTFTAYNMTTYSATASTDCGGFGSLGTGLPSSMSPGVWYVIYVQVAITPSAVAGQTPTFSVAFGS
ncbi:MAG: hypothetical protein JRN50_02375 [Nitrososphaerota archaeon]|nr:hypothetical protein [Nitrososphaerota archaeon]